MGEIILREYVSPQEAADGIGKLGRGKWVKAFDAGLIAGDRDGRGRRMNTASCRAYAASLDAKHAASITPVPMTLRQRVEQFRQGNKHA